MDLFFLLLSKKPQRFILSLAILLLCLIPISVVHSADVSNNNINVSSKPTAYEVLKDYDFPSGILPKGVLDYELDSSTGKFAAFLNGSCSFSLDGSYQLKYKPDIKGHITKGKLSGLTGVSVKVFFMWVDIIEVSRNGDSLDFSVGIAGAGFPIDNFFESPQCGCGLNCDNDQLKFRKIKKNPFLVYAY